MAGNPPEQSLHATGGKRIFRIGHMGNTASPDHLLLGMGRVEAALRQVGYDVLSGATVKPARGLLMAAPVNPYTTTLLSVGHVRAGLASTSDRVDRSAA
jgi:hypothetical protein